MRPAAARYAVGILAFAPLVVHFVLWTTADYSRVLRLRRYGEDMAIATTAYLERLSPTHLPAVRLSSAGGYVMELQSFLLEEEQRLGVRPWQFWRTLPQLPPARPGPVIHRSNDDMGRAWLTEWGFRILGGIAPFLILWLALFAIVPVLAWLVWELARSKHLFAGVVIALACGCSPFMVESLALPYSAHGFYLVALLGVSALSVYAALRTPSTRGLLLRAAATGVLLALCALCRDAVILFLPGVVLALALGARRIAGKSWRHRGVVGLGALALVALPLASMRPPTHHEMWTGTWQGLGDYDRSKGHVWSDAAALELVRAAGLDRDVPPEVTLYDRDLASPEKEAFFRELVWRDVRSDPIWFVRILARRVVATVSQDELLLLSTSVPRDENGPRAPKVPRNQGNIRFYYHLVTTADWMAVGRWRFPVPLGVFWSLGTTFVVLAVWPRGWLELRPAAGVLACTAAAALTMPVLVTTAGALETESFIVVYFLALGFLAEAAWERARRRP